MGLRSVMMMLLEEFGIKLSKKIGSLFVWKEDGKGLSSNDYTSEDKEKLEATAKAVEKKVPAGRKINGKTLAEDISLSAEDVSAIPASARGSVNGVAELDANGKVPAAQLPSYVDDVIEGYLSEGKLYKDAELQTEIPPESGKIYVDMQEGKIYRWSGTKYVVISDTVALGETPQTAFRGDWGKQAYEHSQADHAPANAAPNVQADWEEEDETSDAYIKNKPQWGDIEIADESDIDNIIAGTLE